MVQYVGFRLFNDDTTPMDVVMRLLTAEFGLSEGNAFAAMLRVHKAGQEIVALVPEAEAEAVAARVTAAIEKSAVELRFEMTAPLDPTEAEEWRRASQDWRWVTATSSRS